MMRSIRVWLVSGLWLAWLGLLPGTFVAMQVTGQGHWSRFWWMSSVVLAVCAWINSYFHRRDHLGIGCALVATGMTLGTLADGYGAFNILRFTEPLVVIIPLFALGHVSYVTGLVTLAKRLRLTQLARWRSTLIVTIVVYMLIGLLLWTVVVSPSNALPKMHIPTAGYTLFLALSAAVMATVALLDRRFWAVSIGGLLFLISDGFLAIRLFQNNWRGLGDLCWITYGIGQMLIVYGTLMATWERSS